MTNLPAIANFRNWKYIWCHDSNHFDVFDSLVSTFTYPVSVTFKCPPATTTDRDPANKAFYTRIHGADSPTKMVCPHSWWFYVSAGGTIDHVID
jgi:hypothetical protein